jgi:hypothetical protein
MTNECPGCADPHIDGRCCRCGRPEHGRPEIADPAPAGSAQSTGPPDASSGPVDTSGKAAETELLADIFKTHDMIRHMLNIESE